MHRPPPRVPPKAGRPLTRTASSKGPRLADPLASLTDRHASSFSRKRKSGRPAQRQRQAKSKIKGNSGNLHARSLTDTVCQWVGLLIGYECGKKNRLCGQGAFAAYPRQAKSRLSAVFHDPLTAPVFFRHFPATANPHPIGIRCPPRKGVLCLSIWFCGRCAAVLRAFDPAPLNPWFRLAIIEKYTLTICHVDLKIIVFIYLNLYKYMLLSWWIFEIIVSR